MAPRNLVLLGVIGITLAGCQRGADEHAKDSTAESPAASASASPDNWESDSRTQELERRVAELEQRLASPAPQPTPVLRVEETRTPAPKRPATPRPAARAATPAPQRDRDAAPVEEPRRTADAEPSRSTREPAPEPRPRAVTIPEDAELSLVLETGLSSATSEIGDRVVARVERAEGEDGRVSLPSGAVLEGRVTDVRRSGKVKGRARLVVSFDRLAVRGDSYPIDTTDIEVEADSEGKKDAVIIGGSTVAGAVLGAIVKGGAKKGAVIGAAGGTAAVLLTKGKEIEIPSGSRWVVRVRRPARLG
jgi:type IV secretion system protein VirB10